MIHARQRRVEIADRLAACGLDRRGRHVWIVDQHGHFHREAALGGARADAAEADDQDGLSGEVDRHVLPAILPSVLAHRRVLEKRLLGEPVHHEHGVLGDRHRVRGADHHQRNLARGERRNIDRVVADADARGDPQPRRDRDLRPFQGRQRQRDAVRVLQRRLQVRHRDVGVVADRLDVVARRHHVPAGLGQRVRQHHFLLVRRHGSLCGKGAARRRKRREPDIPAHGRVSATPD